MLGVECSILSGEGRVSSGYILSMANEQCYIRYDCSDLPSRCNCCIHV